MGRWAIDLGTSKTGVARWDEAARRAELIYLRKVALPPRPARPLDAAQLVPSMVELLPRGFAVRVGRWGPLRRNAFIGRSAFIGVEAWARNEALPRPSFTPSFKSALMREPTRAVARVGTEIWTARDAARAFFRELLREVRVETGERVRDVVFTVPIDCYDSYRAELRDIAIDAGVKKVGFVDEPVAAAMGYGVGLGGGRRVLVFDMGGGTLHAAVDDLDLRAANAGTCRVLAKVGHAVGGNLVDRWVLEAAATEVQIPLTGDPADEDEAIWQRIMLAECRRVKEAVHTEEQAQLILIAPEELRGMKARLHDRPPSITFSRERLRSLLEARGLFTLLGEVVDEVTGPHAPIDEVLLVGGSSLLPGLYPWFEARFGRDRVRAWQPFDAVVLGAAAFSGAAFLQSDIIVHDYAIRTHDAKTGAPEHVVVVPAGTRFPTAPDFWRRQLVPTCARGDPETMFKLVLCEIGRQGGDRARFGWDASGTLRPLGGSGASDVVVALNGGDPTLGFLNPPHAPDDRRARLDVSMGVDADRWLIATIVDLHTQKVLWDKKPVARLL